LALPFASFTTFSFFSLGACCWCDVVSSIVKH
jgi:hypothetical protein